MAKPNVLASYRKLESGMWQIASAFLTDYIWSDGRNIQFIDGGVAKTDGWSRITAASLSISVPIFGMNENIRNSKRSLIMGTTARLFMYDGTSTTSVGSGYTGTLCEGVVTSATQWSLEPWGEWMLCTNGTNTPQIFKENTASAKAMTSTTFTKAEIFLRFRDYMMAFNTSNGVNSIEWSDANKPESWTIASTNSAGQIIVREIDSPIIAAKPLGNAIAVYTINTMHLVDFVDLPLVFRVSHAITGIGAVSKNSVVNLNRLNYGLSRQGFFMTDGFTFNYIDEPALRSFFADRIRWAHRSKVAAVHDEESHQIIWSYPLSITTAVSTENNESIGFDYIRNLWTIYGQGWTAMHAKELFDNVFFSDTNGRLFAMHSGTSNDGGSLTCCLTTNTFDFGNPNAIKHVQGLKIGGVISGTGLQVRVGVQKSLGEAIAYSAFQAVDNSNNFIPFDVSGRWVTLNFQSQATGNTWNIQSIDVYGATIGNRL